MPRYHVPHTEEDDLDDELTPSPHKDEVLMRHHDDDDDDDDDDLPPDLLMPEVRRRRDDDDDDDDDDPSWTSTSPHANDDDDDDLIGDDLSVDDEEEAKEEDPGPKDNHYLRGSVPLAWLVSAERLGRNHARLAVRLLWRSGMRGHGEFEASQEDLALWGLRADAVRSAMRALIKAGLVKVVQKGSGRTTTRYFLRFSEDWSSRFLLKRAEMAQRRTKRRNKVDDDHDAPPPSDSKRRDLDEEDDDE